MKNRKLNPATDFLAEAVEAVRAAGDDVKAQVRAMNNVVYMRHYPRGSQTRHRVEAVHGEHIVSSGRRIYVYLWGLDPLLPSGHSYVVLVPDPRHPEILLGKPREHTATLRDGTVELFPRENPRKRNGACRANPRMKYIDETAESMVNQEVAAIKAQGPASAACLSEHGAWGYVYDVLTYLYGHEMEGIARRFTAGIISGDLGAVHLDDRILNKPAVGRNMQNKVSGAQAARAFRALRELCASKRTCVACKGTGQLRGQTCSWCGGTGGGARSNGGMAPFGGDMGFGRTNPIRGAGVNARGGWQHVKGSGVWLARYSKGPSFQIIREESGDYTLEQGLWSARASSFKGAHNRQTFRTLSEAQQAAASARYRWAQARQNPLDGPGAPSMFNNMSDVLQGNVGRRNSGSPFAVNDRVTMRAGHHTGMGSPDGTVTHPGASRSLVRFDDGTLVDVENRALVPLRRNLGDGPPPPPPVGNPRGYGEQLYPSARVLFVDGNNTFTVVGPVYRSLTSHAPGGGYVVVDTRQGGDRVFPLTGRDVEVYTSDSEDPVLQFRGMQKVRGNPLRRNHHLHPGDRVSMGAFIGTVDQQLPGTYDTYRVQWDRGGIDRVEGHKLRKL